MHNWNGVQATAYRRIAVSLIWFCKVTKYFSIRLFFQVEKKLHFFNRCFK